MHNILIKDARKQLLKLNNKRHEAEWESLDINLNKLRPIKTNAQNWSTS